MSTISSFRSIENKFNLHRGKDCTKIFCELLREHAMTLLTKEQHDSYGNAKTCYICKEKYLKDKKYR